MNEPKPSSSWDQLAADLGAEIKPEPEAATPPPPAPAPAKPTAVPRAPKKPRKPAWDSLGAMFGLSPAAPEPPVEEPSEERFEAPIAKAVESPAPAASDESSSVDLYYESTTEVFGRTEPDDSDEADELDDEFEGSQLAGESADRDSESDEEDEPRRKRRRRRRGGRGRRDRRGAEADTSASAEGRDDDEAELERERACDNLASELITGIDAEAIRFDASAEDLELLGPDDVDSIDDEGEGDEPTERKRRRRRRRRGRRDRDDARGEERADAELPGESAALASYDDHDDHGDDDDDDTVRASHKGIPSWKDTIEVIISTNMAARSKNARGTSAPPRRNGQRGGRGKRSGG